MAKNTLIISKYAITPRYGNPTRQFYIAKYLSKLGDNVTLISSQSSSVNQYEKLKNYYHLDEIEHVNCYLMKGDRIQLGFSIKRIISWIFFEWRVLRLCLFSKQIQKPDVILVSSLSLLTFLTGVFLKKRYKCTLVVEVRDIWPLTLIKVGGYSSKNIFVRVLSWIEQMGYKHADAIVGTMPNLKEHIQDTYPKLKDKKVYCIPQGYDPEECVIDNKFSENFNANLQLIDHSTFNIIYAGTLGKTNRIDFIIDICKRLKSNNHIKFYILGDGPLLDETKSFARLHSNLVVLDKLAKSEVHSFLSYFDIQLTVIPNSDLYRYGVSSNKLIDYMRSGRPILYAYEGYESLINGNEYAFRVPFDLDTIVNKIILISEMSKEELTQMGENGKRILEENHKFNVLAARYIHIFEKS